MVVLQQIAIWDLTVPWIKKLKKIKMGVFFLQHFDLRHGLTSNHDPSSHNYFTSKFFQDLGPLKSIYLTELRAAAQIVLRIIARFNICKNLSSAQISLKSGDLNLKLCYYANKQQLTKLSLVLLLSCFIFAGLIWVVLGWVRLYWIEY